MVVLTVSATQNPCTVNFDEPIPKADFVRLLSRSLTNSWDNQTRRLSISLYSNDGSTVVKTNTLLSGFYTAEDVAINFNALFSAQNAQLKAFAHTSDSKVVIYNPKNKNILMDQGHADF